jgi:hypothetical protein
MAKIKVELEQMDWQVMLMLVGQGYNDLSQRIATQLNIARAEMQPPAGNGTDRPEPPGGNA